MFLSCRYTPVAQSMTCYRVGPDGSTACSDCCYCAPTMRFSITLDTKLAYSCFVMVGTVEQVGAGPIVKAESECVFILHKGLGLNEGGAYMQAFGVLEICLAGSFGVLAGQAWF